MKYILETERLQLREFTLQDTAFLIELMNSPGWLKYIGDRNVKSEEQARSYLLNGAIKSYAEKGYGFWLVESKTENKAVGMCGITHREFLDDPDIGFAFLPEFAGRGYALESAEATMQYAKNTLHIPRISAITVSDNDRSVRLLKKIGLSFKNTFCFPGSEEELLLFSN